IAIKYAALNPGRVRNLILWSTYARTAEYSQGPQVQATRALVEKDWALYTEAVSHTLLGWSQGEAARRYASFIRAISTAQSVRAFIAATQHRDVSDVLHHVASPTLVLHRWQVAWVATEASQRLAAMIPDARLRTLDGDSILPFLGDAECVIREIVAFTQGSHL